MSPTSWGMWAFVAGAGLLRPKNRAKVTSLHPGGGELGWSRPRGYRIRLGKAGSAPGCQGLFRGWDHLPNPKPGTQHQAHPRDDPRPALTGQNAPRGCGRPGRERGIRERVGGGGPGPNLPPLPTWGRPFPAECSQGGEPGARLREAGS